MRLVQFAIALYLATITAVALPAQSAKLTPPAAGKIQVAVAISDGAVMQRRQHRNFKMDAVKSACRSRDGCRPEVAGHRRLEWEARREWQTRELCPVHPGMNVLE